MVSKERVEEMLQEETVRAIEAGVPVSDRVNPKIKFVNAKSFYGQCCPLRQDGYDFYIKISNYYLLASEQEIRETLMHELLHTCPGCMNHQAKWRSYAKSVNDAYGYGIQRVNNPNRTFSLSEAAVKVNPRKKRPANKYCIECISCGRKWYRTRRSNLTEYSESYHCICGGRLRKIVL